MGTWGTAIFSDDLAADIRNDWREHIGDGLTPEVATDRILSDYADSVRDADEAPVTWLALAVAQWKTGLLLDTVRHKALEVIESGADLRRWEESPKLHAQRARVLVATRSLLLSPQRPARRIARRRRSASPFVEGDLLCYQHVSGQKFVFWVSRNHSDKGGEYSDVELLDFTGSEPPSIERLVRLPAMTRRYVPRTDGSVAASTAAGFTLIHAARLPADRVSWLGNRGRPRSRPHHDLTVVFAKDLDDHLVPFLVDGDHVIRSRRK